MASSEVLPVSPRHSVVGGGGDGGGGGGGGGGGAASQCLKVRAKYDDMPAMTHCRAVARIVSTPVSSAAARRLPNFFGNKLRHRLSEPVLLPELRTMREAATPAPVVTHSSSECELASTGRSDDCGSCRSTDSGHGSAPGDKPDDPVLREPDEDATKVADNDDGGKTGCAADGEAQHADDHHHRDPLEKLVRTLQQRCKDQQAEIFSLKTKSATTVAEYEQWKRRRGSELLQLSAQLYWLESNLRKEQQRLKWCVESRDRTIHMQHRTIHQLTQQLKDKPVRSCSCVRNNNITNSQGMNSVPGSPQNEVLDPKSVVILVSGVEKCTDDDSAVVMDDDCADCSAPPRMPTSIMRSVSDALECACVQNSDSRRHSSPAYTLATAASPAATSLPVRRGSLKHNMDHPFNSYLRKPEVLETVYSVDEESEDVDAHAANKVSPSGCSGGGISFELPRSESCEFNKSFSVVSRTHSSPAVALMNRLRPKKYFGSCDNVALAMKNERMSSYKPKSMENLMNAVELPTASDDCLLYRYEVFDRFATTPPPPPLLDADPDAALDADARKYSRRQSKSAAVPVIKNNHKNVTRPRDLKAKRANNAGNNNNNNNNNTTGNIGPSKRSKSVEELRFKFWDWMGLRRNRQS
ncbi:unnamed protein product [Notodromas monacha]|uniref:Uncharacterized protein n=1 Tax=Notodromas monacha TaxID=399045 RepID=A0A7R9BIG0_9CRUS|nr:unnamed protein product [Notodromas monacha]CAG0914532.1 unnamed protein product [Notodromas monacha]